jgi:hypothetical protein
VTLSATERTTGAGGRVTRRDQLVADMNGHFKYAVVAGPSRTVELGYGASIAHVTVRGKAGVTLKTSLKRVRNGTTLRFSGAVLGEAGTRRAALVTIYALTRGSRSHVPVETVRARASGHFSYAYRFRSIPAPSVYRFQARVPKQTGFPYLEGTSRSVVVRDRP